MQALRDFEKDAAEFWAQFEETVAWDKTTTVGVVGRSIPVAVKDCPQCENPGPMVVLDQRFVCRKCSVLFS